MPSRILQTLVVNAPSRILQTLVVNAPPHRKYAHVLASDILEFYAGRSIHVSEIGKIWSWHLLMERFGERYETDFESLHRPLKQHTHILIYTQIKKATFLFSAPGRCPRVGK